jgi:dTDP-4-amino-4,6-dideoxygalactose transaminase
VIPFLDLGPAYTELQTEIDEAIKGVLTSSRYILGPEVAAFESEFAAYVGAEHCIGVASGYDALFLSLVALGIGPGDDVVVASNTYIATWLAVSKAGARPVPVEPDHDTMNISLSAITGAVTPRTKAVLPVHLYGYPVDLGPIRDFCDRHDLLLIEDAAQAHGAACGTHRIGAHSHAAAWSFYPSKNLGGLGDGGAVTTSDPQLAQLIRELGNYGSLEKNVHVTAGFNSRLDELQAAILRVKLTRLDEWNGRRRQRAERYLMALGQTDLLLPPNDRDVTPAWHLFVVRHPRRNDLRARLELTGINTQIHYPTPPHLQPAYAYLGLHRGRFPVSESLHDTVLSLPFGPHMTDGDQDAVIESIAFALADPLFRTS